MKSIKETEMLMNLAQALGQEVDESTLKQAKKISSLKREVLESVRSNIFTDLAKASKVKPTAELVTEVETPPLVSEFKVVIPNPVDFPLPPSLDDIAHLLDESKPVQEVQPIEEVEKKDIEPQTMAMATAKFIEENKESFQQPEVEEIDPNDVAKLTKKIKFLEQWLSKISMTGPGGGAGDVITLDHPVKLVTSNYTINRKDYYIGVNAASAITITLPDSIGFPGRMIIIKDESGNCANNPITVNGTVDNDTGGFILAQNNGGIQMIYRNGWRIV